MNAMPRFPSDITPGWLTATLHSAGVACDPVTRVDGERVGALVGITSVVLRVRPTYGGGSSGPASLIAKLALADPDVRERIRALGMYDREIRFYREIAPELGALVPKCYLAELDDDGWFILLLEDLSYAREGDDDGGCSVDDISSALAAVARLHADWWEQGLQDVPWLSSAGVAHVSRKRLESSLQPFLARFGRDMSPAHGRFLSRLVPALAAGSLKWPAPRTLVHGDLSAKNVFFVDAGGATRVVMFDWQLVAHGHPARDAATLINRSLPPDAWARDATCLLRFYFEALVGAGVRGFSFEELLDTYRRVSLIQMATAVNIGGGIAEPDPARVSIVRRSLERAPVILDSFDVDQYLS